MKRVTKWLTFDGKMHDNHVEARNYLEKLYSDKLAELAKVFIGLNYKHAHAAIRKHTKDFAILQRIQENLIVTRDDMEWNKCHD